MRLAGTSSGQYQPNGNAQVGSSIFSFRRRVTLRPDFDVNAADENWLGNGMITAARVSRGSAAIFPDLL